MPETKQWTLMFYMASDNPLAISIVSQLKAIKDAGFHPEVNVIAQFDPFTEGTPTHIFDVNLINKLKHPHSPNIGFSGPDSFVRNLIEDKLWRDEKRVKENDNGSTEEELVRDALEDLMHWKYEVPCILPRAPEVNGSSRRTSGARRHEPDPYSSLRTFLDFCSQRYPAERYMLFMLGHGVVVGNDVFMFDEHAEKKSITLSEMGELLSEFSLKIKEEGSTFELVSFHSCSVSSLEVAYELKGTAKYMLASQAPAFVGSWPYRQILIRIFNGLQKNGKDIEELVSDIFSYCVYNGADYLLAGYSHQVTLCDLHKVEELRGPMQTLASALVNGLDDAASKFVILYAHWRSQSFFDEMYTDLWDFCRCIIDRCERIEESKLNSKEVLEKPLEELLPKKLQPIKKACRAIIDTLGKPDGPKQTADGRRPKAIIRSEFVGPAYQYSHGLSVYFPWVQPSDDSGILNQYDMYKFHQELKVSSNGSNGKVTWLDFLLKYFEQTKRETQKTEQTRQQCREELLARMRAGNLPVGDDLEKALKSCVDQKRKPLTPEEKQQHEFAKLQEDIASLIYNGEGPLGGYALTKYGSSDRTGDDCTCGSFKNFPRDTRASRKRSKKAQPMPVSETLLGEF